MVKPPWSCSAVAIAALVIAACGDESEGDSTADAASAGPSGSSSGGASPSSSSSSSSDGGGSTGSGASGAGGSGSGGGALSFENDIWPVLTMPRDPPLSGSNDSCSGANGCHLGGAGGLSMPDSSTAYANLIDVPSNSALCAGLLQVVASKPDESCFIVFYEQRLRDQLGWVEQAETDFVRAWVEQGAAP